MQPSKIGSSPASFILQLMRNKFLLLTVVLAVSAAAYFGIGLFMLLRN